MSESLKDIVVRVSAQSQGFESLDTAAQKIESVNSASLSFVDRISASAKGFETLGSMGMGVVHVLDRIEISQMAVENATGSVMNAQLRYNEAVSKYGEDSQQAFIAGNELARSQNNLEKANQRAAISMVAIGISAVGTIPAIVSFGKNMVTTLKGVELATLITTARIKAMVPELLVLSAVAGGAYYLITTQTAEAQSAQDEFSNSMAKGFSSANEKAEDLKRTIEGIRDAMKSSEMKAEQKKVEYEASTAAIKESGLSEEEKARRIGDLKLKYAEDIARIELEQSAKAWELAQGSEGAAKAKAEYTEREMTLQKIILQGQNEITQKGRTNPFHEFYSGASAPSSSSSSSSSSLASTDFGTTFHPSKALEEIQKEAEKKVQEVNVVEFLNSKNAPAPQFEKVIPWVKPPAGLSYEKAMANKEIFYPDPKNTITRPINITVHNHLDSQDILDMFDGKISTKLSSGVNSDGSGE